MPSVPLIPVSISRTPAQEVASLFFRETHGAGPPAPPPELRTFSVRLEATRLAQIEAMAQVADVSRNAMAVRLLEVGINAVMHEIPPEVRTEIFPEGTFEPDHQGDF